MVIRKVNASSTCTSSNNPSLSAILEFLCYSVYSPALDFLALFFFFVKPFDSTRRDIIERI